MVLLVFSPELMEAQDRVKDRDQDHHRLMMVDGSLVQIKDLEQTQLKDKVGGSSQSLFSLRVCRFVDLQIEVSCYLIPNLKINSIH